MKMVQCAGCDRPIMERFLLNVLERSWHAKCVQCCECKSNLTEKCFSRDGNLYCRNDFFKRFGTKCTGCGHGILPTDLVRRARNKVFHLKCFTCFVCRKQLSTGEELYVLDENRFICKEDYLSSRHNQVLAVGSPGEPDLDERESMVSPTDPDLGLHDSDHEDDLLGGSLGGLGQLSSSNLAHSSGHSAVMSSKSSPMSASSSMSDSGISGANGTNGPDPTSPSHTTSSNSAGNDENTPGGTKRRGPRTTIKAKQLETLKSAFAATPKPTRHIREQLAQETGLNMRVIQVWFQNRRSKERRMKQLSTLGARRHFFRSPRRAMRQLRPGLSPDGLEDSPEMGPGPNGFGYFSDSSNPSEFPYGAPPPHHPGHPGPGFYDFFPGQGPPHLNEGPPGLVPQFVSNNPGSHPPVSAPGMHESVHQPALFRACSLGSVNLGADAPFMGGSVPGHGPHGPSPAEIMAAQQHRASASPSVDSNGVLNLPPLTPDTYGRSSSESNGNANNNSGFSTPLQQQHPPMSEQSVW